MLRCLRTYAKWLFLAMGLVGFSGLAIAYLVQGTLSVGDIRAYGTMLGMATLIVGLAGFAIALWLAALARTVTGRDNAITRWVERG